MADIFLSYARESAEAATRIAAALRDQGYSVWFDEELPAHRAYADVIAAELDTARAVLVIWSWTCSGVHAGCCSISRAATPAASGDAMDVPLAIRWGVSEFSATVESADSTFSPGAITSTAASKDDQ